MRFDNLVIIISNYVTDIDKALRHLGERGYRLVSTEMAKNIHDITVMYLFLQRKFLIYE